MHDLERKLRELCQTFPAFAEELQFAWDYVQTDPGSSLTKSRLITEKLLMELYQAEMEREPKKPLLGEMLLDNQFTRKLDRRICSRMNAIRDMGNLGPHGERVEPSDARRVLEDVCEVLDWYHQRPRRAGNFSGEQDLKTSTVAFAPRGKATGRMGTWSRSRWIAAGVLLVLLGGLAVAVMRSPAPPLSGNLDVIVWKKDDLATRRGLGEVGVLPLRQGDFIRIETTASEPVYFYVVSLEADGKAVPLFPWRKRDWNNRAVETRVAELNLPDDPPIDMAPLGPGPSGIESVIVLARRTPLTVEENERLRQVLTGQGQEGKVDPLRGAVWLSGGGEQRFSVEEDKRRGSVLLEQGREAVDPVERVRRQMRRELRALGAVTRAVCYPFEGR